VKSNEAAHGTHAITTPNSCATRIVAACPIKASQRRERKSLLERSPSTHTSLRPVHLCQREKRAEVREEMEGETLIWERWRT
jgi:hypothetical protein